MKPLLTPVHGHRLAMKPPAISTVLGFSREKKTHLHEHETLQNIRLKALFSRKRRVQLSTLDPAMETAKGGVMLIRRTGRKLGRRLGQGAGEQRASSVPGLGTRPASFSSSPQWKRRLLQPQGPPTCWSLASSLPSPSSSLLSRPLLSLHSHSAQLGLPAGRMAAAPCCGTDGVHHLFAQHMFTKCPDCARCCGETRTQQQQSSTLPSCSWDSGEGSQTVARTYTRCCE